MKRKTAQKPLSEIIMWDRVNGKISLTPIFHENYEKADY